MSKTQSLAPVIEYLRECPGEPFHLTPEKVRERGCLIDDPDRPDKRVFEVQRHSGILGSVYRPGRPMAAFITYWPVYEFDPSTEELTELEAHREPVVNIEDWLFVERQMEMMMELHFEPQDDETYLCIEGVMNEEKTVRNVEEAMDFAEELVRNWNTEFWKDELSPYMDEEEIQSVIERLQEKCREAARNKVQQSWEFQVEED